MSNDPTSTTPPGDNPPTSLPELKKSVPQKAEEESDDSGGGLLSGVVTVVMIVVGIGFALWDKKEEAKQEPRPIVLPKLNAPALKLAVDKSDSTRSLVKKAIDRSAKVSTQEECETVRKMLTSAANISKMAAPDLLPEVERAQRDLTAREPTLPKLADKLKAGSEPGQRVPIAPPPREVNR